MADRHIIITIGRQYGSGGAEIGQKLAGDLGIHCYDKNILALNADESGISESYFHLVDEKAGNRLLCRIIAGMCPPDGRPSFGADLTSADNLFRFQSEVIRKLAAEESCVFIGRCADYVLAGHEDLVRVHVNASWDYRVARIREKGYVSGPDVEKSVRRVDRERRDYYRYYTGRDWADASNYDLVIDSTRIGTDGAVCVIESYLRARGYELDKEFPAHIIEK